MEFISLSSFLALTVDARRNYFETTIIETTWHELPEWALTLRNAVTRKMPMLLNDINNDKLYDVYVELTNESGNTE